MVKYSVYISEVVPMSLHFVDFNGLKCIAKNSSICHFSESKSKKKCNNISMSYWGGEVIQSGSYTDLTAKQIVYV